MGRSCFCKKSQGVTIRNPATGATRVELGNSYSFSGSENIVEHFGGNLWLWQHATGKVHRLDAAVIHAQPMAAHLSWSPVGHTLLATLQDQRTHAFILALYDPASMHWHLLRTVSEETMPYWTPDGAGVLTIEPAQGQTSRVVLTPVTGHSRLLFTHPYPINALAISPDGQRLAVFSNHAILLLDAAGHTLHTLNVPIAAELPGVKMVFAPHGERLAILSTAVTGEPHIFYREELYTATVDTGALQRLTQWHATLGSTPGGDPLHSLLRWTPDSDALLLNEHPGTLAGPATEWRKLLRAPLVPVNRPYRYSSPAATSSTWRFSMQ